jgi:type I restriction enzyme, S subunit
MRLNYKPIGDYIREVKEKNVDLKAKSLLGININKFFMPSVANVIGTDMSNYKIVKKSQFACNRMHVGRDYRIPIALSNSNESFMVSPAYDVFAINDTSILLPEYLMMWFSRKEFDRNAWFYTDADVRGGLAWKAFCDMAFPVVSIEKQREIVAEYNVIQNRIKLNNRLINKLEETAQAIYNSWFVDFEFPDENGKPYKSNGGEMEFNKELEKEIPKGWEVGTLGKFGNLIMGQSPNGETYNLEGIGMPLVNGPVEFGDYFPVEEKWTTKPTRLSEKNDLIICVRGSTVGRFVKSDGVYCLGRGVGILRNEKYQNYLDILYKTNLIKLVSLTTGSTFPNWDRETLSSHKVILPSESVLRNFELIGNKVTENIGALCKSKIKLIELLNLLLSKLATIEN